MKYLYSKTIFTFLFLSFFANNLNAQYLGWSKATGGLNFDGGNSVAVDAAGNVYTTGTFQGTVDFDPGTGVTSLTSYGSFDVFVTKFSASGNLLWAKNWGSLLDERGYALALDASSNVYVTGYFKTTV